MVICWKEPVFYILNGRKTLPGSGKRVNYSKRFCFRFRFREDIAKIHEKTCVRIVVDYIYMSGSVFGIRLWIQKVPEYGSGSTTLKMSLHHLMGFVSTRSRIGAYISLSSVQESLDELMQLQMLSPALALRKWLPVNCLVVAIFIYLWLPARW